MNCMNCKSVVDVGMEICPNCGFNLRVQRKCFSLSNMYYNLGLDKAEIRDLSGAIDMLRRSLKFNKYNIHARNLLGLVYFETGEAVAALSEWIIRYRIQHPRACSGKESQLQTFTTVSLFPCSFFPFFIYFFSCSNLV